MNKTSKQNKRTTKAKPVKKVAVKPDDKIQKTENQLCHVHDEIKFWEDNNDIRESICRDVETIEHSDGKHYCLLHLPGTDNQIKNKNFDKIIKARLKEIEDKVADIKSAFPGYEDKQNKEIEKLSYDFRYVWFPQDASFQNCNFTGDADFSSATITGDADFSSATFTGDAEFNSATFTGYADFSSAKFTGKANFSLATFTEDADFHWATFEEKSQIFFNQTKFSNVLDLSDAKIKGYVKFEGTIENRLFIEQQSFLDLQNAQIDDAKKISFHIVRLEPSWFVNTDAKEFVFTDCKWRSYYGKQFEVKSQLQNLEDRGVFENPNALLTKACWQLAENHENVKEFALASDFREIAQESKRLQDDWYKQPFTLRWWYWLASKYGESSKRAALMFAGIIVVFALFYNSPLASFEPMPNTSEVYKMNNSEGIVHSLGVATFQRPEPKPADSLTKFAITLETILAPLQATLLAFAIRRKFMR